MESTKHFYFWKKDCSLTPRVLYVHVRDVLFQIKNVPSIITLQKLTIWVYV